LMPTPARAATWRIVGRPRTAAVSGRELDNDVTVGTPMIWDQLTIAQNWSRTVVDIVVNRQRPTEEIH
jgi:hypothetical protein